MKKHTSNTNKLADHFFRHNSAKMVAILVRYFGLKEVEIAEDIVQDTLLEAMQKWSTQSIPDNPEGWLIDVAKKKAINLLKRNQLFQKKIIPSLQANAKLQYDFEFNDTIENDSTLRMIFACCHPSLSSKSQISLALKSLCGLSVSEIANALLTNEATINKRLYRAKQKFRQNKIAYEIPNNNELSDRLNNVFTTLYLLFNEGYYSSHHKKTIRIDLCFEAIRLLKQVVFSFPNLLKAKALLSLMLLSIARFESRIDKNGALIILAEQDRELWDKTLIAEGVDYLHQSTKGKEVNSYQLQAGISAEHCLAKNFKSTNWKSIYKQYSILEKLDMNVIIKLNKSIAKFYLNQKKEALVDLLNLIDEHGLKNNTLFYTTVGVFYSEMNQKAKSIPFFKTAIELSTSIKEKALIQKKISL